ncbi:MAG: hypothetical protein ACRBI6_04535 [Acidimicrobiales bacterium]
MATEAQKEARVRERVARLRALPRQVRESLAMVAGDGPSLLILALDVIDGYRTRVKHLEGLLADGARPEAVFDYNSQDLPESPTQYANLHPSDLMHDPGPSKEERENAFRVLSHVLNIELPSGGKEN